MYRLILSHSERIAFDWVGDRYSNGNNMRNLIEKNNDKDWDSPEDVEYAIPEHIAWEIRELAEQDNYLFPCFSNELTDKMLRFIDNIV